MDTVEFPDVVAIDDTGLVLVCLIGGRRVLVPRLPIDPRSEVQRAGDRGTLLIPRWLAADLGLA
jgi:hypothetical protein